MLIRGINGNYQISDESRFECIAGGGGKFPLFYKMLVEVMDLEVSAFHFNATCIIGGDFYPAVDDVCPQDNAVGKRWQCADA